MNSEDELLLLAHGIVTFSTVVDGLEDLDTLQVTTPYRMEGLARKHLTAFAVIWWSKVHGDPVWRDEYLARAIAEAREWVAVRQDRLAELRQLRERQVQV